MSTSILQFGEKLPGHDIPVLNERAVRASAGILFFLAMIAFMNAWLTGNFQPTRVFVVSFLVDFTIRIFVNPRLAPSLIMGQWFVRRQQPEWVGAPQKRFAWAIGFVLASAMLYLVVFNRVIGPVNLLVCALCLTLLFFESAFGICLGCKLYNLCNREKAQLCPGGVCEAEPVKSAGMDLPQLMVVLAFAGIIAAVAQRIYSTGPQTVSADAPTESTAPAAMADPAEAERCKVPDFAKAIGHEEKWKLHNHCR